MEKKDVTAPTVPFVDDPSAPDLFASEAVGFFIEGQTVAITLTRTRVDHATSPPPLSRVVIGRLVMPVRGAQGLAMGLFDFLKAQGFDPIPKPDREKMN